MVAAGADGSPAAATAFEYALGDAMRRGARLRIVAAGQLPQDWVGGYAMSVLPGPDDMTDDLLRGGVRRQLDEVLGAHPELAAVLAPSRR